jgi:predicted HicB family RNase H-like nuclease
MKKDVIEYKGFIGSVHFSEENDILFGKIEEIDDLVTFEGASVKGLRKAFEEAVDDYLELCRQANKEPFRSVKGSFNVRIPPELHRKAIRLSKQQNLNLNQFVLKAIERAVARG